MIQINKYSRKIIGSFFLVIFISFFIISVLHNHHYCISNGQKVISNHSSCNKNVDPYLDGELNCTLHAFSNSISTNFGDADLFDILIQHDQEYFHSLENKSLKKYFSQFNLRAPPGIII